MPIQVVADPVVAHGGARVGVPGRNLHVSAGARQQGFMESADHHAGADAGKRTSPAPASAPKLALNSPGKRAINDDYVGLRDMRQISGFATRAEPIWVWLGAGCKATRSAPSASTLGASDSGRARGLAVANGVPAVDVAIRSPRLAAGVHRQPVPSGPHSV